MEAKDEEEEISQMLDFLPDLRSIFIVEGKVGEGTFSKVYKARVKTDIVPDKKYALKYLVPTSRPSRIASELQCLKEVGGRCNIVGIELSLMQTGHVVIVMPYFPHQRFADYIHHLVASDIRDYMKNLLLALEEIHAHGIIHRDVKPNNFLCDRTQKRYALVDFGLAQRTQVTEKQILPKPFKDHNAMHDILNKNEPSRTDDIETLDLKYPPHLMLPKKRLLSLDQENDGNPVKKLAFDFANAQNNAFHPCVSSKPSPILPTPPPTPSSTLVNARNLIPEPETHTQKRGNQKICQCFGEHQVCKLCLGRNPEEAPRGGTPGFRAPEVLLKCREQSTALDMWSAGVILLSMLSGKYPFFRAEDDLSSLAEIVFITGMNEMKEAATTLGKHIVMNLPGFVEVSKVRKQLTPSRYLQAVCTMFRSEEVQCNRNDVATSSMVKKSHSLLQEVPESAYDLLNKLLDPNPSTRITASAALAHPFISELNSVY